MLVAVAQGSSSLSTRSQHDKIIGFVDVDTRKPNQPTSYTYNPRPYLSDLCVHPDYRRLGVARALIRACESFCVQQQQPQPQLYIRVKASNVAAVAMYDSMGYESIPNPDDPGEESILILCKNLTCAPKHEPEVERRQGISRDDIGRAAGAGGGDANRTM